MRAVELSTKSASLACAKASAKAVARLGKLRPLGTGTRPERACERFDKMGDRYNNGDGAFKTKKRKDEGRRTKKKRWRYGDVCH